MKILYEDEQKLLIDVENGDTLVIDRTAAEMRETYIGVCINGVKESYPVKRASVYGDHAIRLMEGDL